jgi:hypothetical protein
MSRAVIPLENIQPNAVGSVLSEERFADGYEQSFADTLIRSSDRDSL